MASLGHNELTHCGLVTPLPRPMLTYCLSDTFQDRIQWNFDQNTKKFFFRCSFDKMLKILFRPQCIKLCILIKAYLSIPGWLWVQEGHSWHHHQHSGGEHRGQGGGSGSSLRVHRGLWAHRAGHTYPSPAGTRGATHHAASQVHQVYLQQSDPGESCSQSR